NVLMALDLHEDGEKTETGIPDDDFLFAALRDLGIDQRPGFGSGQLQKDDALRNAQLRCSDAATVARLLTPVRERIAQVCDQIKQVGVIVRELVRPRFLTKGGVSELEDITDSHRASSSPGSI